MSSSSINRELLSDLKHEMWQWLKVKYHAGIGDRFIKHSLALAVMRPWVGQGGGWVLQIPLLLWVKSHIIPEMMSHRLSAVKFKIKISCYF